MHGKNSTILVALILLLWAPAAFADVLTGTVAPLDLFGNKNDKGEPHKTGDLVTVLVSEQISTSTDLESTIKDDFTQAAPGGGGLLSFVPIIANSSANDSKAQDTITQKNLLTTTFTVRVMAVDSSGNLTLEGKREVTSNKKKVTLFLHGVARGKDVANNQVSSSRMSDLTFVVDGLPTKTPVDFIRRLFGIIF